MTASPVLRPHPRATAPARHSVPQLRRRRVVVGLPPDGCGDAAASWALDYASRSRGKLHLVPSEDGDLAAILTVATRYDVVALTRSEAVMAAVALAGCPVTVVPQDWLDAGSTGPVVLVLPPYLDDVAESVDPVSEAIGWAFAAAECLQAPLRVLTAWVPPIDVAGDAAVRARMGHEQEQSQLRRIAPWAGRFPVVEVELRTVMQATLFAVRDAEAGAQLLVVPRNSGLHGPGCGTGSTARALVRHARLPVTVVPVGEVPPPQAGTLSLAGLAPSAPRAAAE